MGNIITGIRNLIYWLPIIWRDRDWDYEFLLRIMIFKLERMSRFFFSDSAVTVDSVKVALEMSHVKNALRRVVDDKNRREMLEIHRAKWGEPGRIFRYVADRNAKELVCLRWPNVTNWRDQEQAEHEFSAAMTFADHMDEEMWKFVFDTMRDRSRSWWD